MIINNPIMKKKQVSSPILSIHTSINTSAHLHLNCTGGLLMH